MENQELINKNITSLTKKEKQIYDFLIRLNKSCIESVPFINVTNAAQALKISDLTYFLPALNNCYVLIKDGKNAIWNPNKLVTSTLARAIYTEYLKLKNKITDSEKTVNTINKKELERIPSNYKPINKNSTVSGRHILKDDETEKYGNIREQTIDKYTKFMSIIADNRITTTSRFYDISKDMQITSGLKTTMEKFGLIVTVKRDVMWDDSVIPSRRLAIRLAQYTNAVYAKRELPTFDIKDYKSCNSDVETITSDIVTKPTVVMENITKVNTDAIMVSHINVNPVIPDTIRVKVTTASEKIESIGICRQSWIKQQGKKNTGTQHARERISKELSISTGEIYRLEYIQKHNPGLIKLIDSGEHSAHSACLAIKKNIEKLTKHSGVSYATNTDIKEENLANVIVGNNASINMLLACELIIQGGDKELALKLMKHQI